MLAEGQADWAMGEAFAFGSLLQDGYHVRLSGEPLLLALPAVYTYRYHTFQVYSCVCVCVVIC